jgi:hypothetical protein
MAKKNEVILVIILHIQIATISLARKLDLHSGSSFTYPNVSEPQCSKITSPISRFICVTRGALTFNVLAI